MIYELYSNKNEIFDRIRFTYEKTTSTNVLKPFGDEIGIYYYKKYNCHFSNIGKVHFEVARLVYSPISVAVCLLENLSSDKNLWWLYSHNMPYSIVFTEVMN